MIPKIQLVCYTLPPRHWEGEQGEEGEEGEEKEDPTSLILAYLCINADGDMQATREEDHMQGKRGRRPHKRRGAAGKEAFK